MRKPSSIPGTIMTDSSAARLGEQKSAVLGPTDHDADGRTHAAQGPIPEPASVAENPVFRPTPAISADMPAETLGRRIVSTAFVMVGPDGHLTVELRNGLVLILRNVVMRGKDYCGLPVPGGPDGPQYCGGYADVIAARPGGSAVPVEPGLAASNPIELEILPSRHE